MIQKDMGEKAKPRLGKSGVTTEVRSGRGAGGRPGRRAAAGRERGRRGRAGEAAAYAVKYTITMIMAKAMRSVGEKVVPSHRTEKMVAAMGSEVPSMLARKGPRSFTPCM